MSASVGQAPGMASAADVAAAREALTIVFPDERGELLLDAALGWWRDGRPSRAAALLAALVADGGGEGSCAPPPGSEVPDIEALHGLLASSFEVSVGRPRVVRRTALDTFDRRLERAGQRLQLVAEAGAERLELVQMRKPW